jgi:hypothetical protein
MSTEVRGKAGESGVLEWKCIKRESTRDQLCQMLSIRKMKKRELTIGFSCMEVFVHLDKSCRIASIKNGIEELVQNIQFFFWEIIL